MRTRLCLALALVLLLVAPGVGAQQGTVAGSVTDQQSGQPLSAVQVFITGPSIGALTQQNGRYLLLNVPVGTHTLTAQLIGYRTVTQQVTVTAGETVVQNFQLAQQALGLDEIIVTGTPGGTQRRAIGNSVTSVQAAEVTQVVAINNMQDLLGGRSPGVQFSRASGNVGTGSQIDIRGIGSFNVGGNPLIYVDGIRVNNSNETGPSLGDMKEVNPLDDLNPQDIESIEIIKGPAAGTLYGTEASAGVIQIITKRGSQGAPQFDVSVTQGALFMRDPAGRIGAKFTCDDSFAPPCRPGDGLVQYNAYHESNRLIAQGAFPWPKDETFSYGHIQSYNASVRGGTESLRYFLSGNYDDEVGSVHYNWDETYRVRANIGVVFNENFSLDVGTGYIDGMTRFGSPAQGDGGEWEDMIWGTGYCVPRINQRDACPRLMGFQEHLPSDVARLVVTRDYNRFTGSSTLNFNTGDWLSSRAIVGVDKGWDENTNYWPLEVNLVPVYEETAVGQLTIEKPTTTNLSFDLSATARFDVTPSLGTATSVGAQYYSKTLSSFANTGRGFPSPLSSTINQTPPSLVQIDFDYVENKSLGVFVQEEVSWNDRLFVTGALRADDNSAFGSDFELEIYPKLSATWVVSEESFWGFDPVNSLRLRGAWGKAGRQPDTFAGTNQYSVIPGPGGTAILNPASPGNPEVGPEVSTELELGMDVAVLDDRISAEFTWFTQKNEDALLGIGIAPSFGFPGSRDQNLGRLDNWGWEAAVNSRLYESADVSFTLDLTASHVDNEIKELGSFGGTNSIRIGYPYPNYTWNRWILDAQYDPNGYYQDNYGNLISATCDGGVQKGEGPQYGYLPGGAPVDCRRDAPPSIFHGRAFDTYKFSINPRINLMNTLQIHILADGAYGRTQFSNQGCGMMGCYNNDYQSRAQTNLVYVAAGRTNRQSMAQFDASFWKLREVGVLWSFPESVAGRIGAERASLSVAGRELWNIWQAEPELWPYGGEGLAVEDPEQGRLAAGQANYRVVPPNTTLTATVRVSF